MLLDFVDSDFGITAADDIAIGITCPALLLPHSTYFIRQFLVLVPWLSFLARCCVFGTAMSIKRSSFVFLYIKVMSDRLKGENHGSTEVKVLCYKSEGRWFDPSWCHRNFSLA